MATERREIEALRKENEELRSLISSQDQSFRQAAAFLTGCADLASRGTGNLIAGPSFDLELHSQGQNALSFASQPAVAVGEKANFAGLVDQNQASWAASATDLNMLEQMAFPSLMSLGSPPGSQDHMADFGAGSDSVDDPFCHSNPQGLNEFKHWQSLIPGRPSAFCLDLLELEGAARHTYLTQTEVATDRQFRCVVEVIWSVKSIADGSQAGFFDSRSTGNIRVSTPTILVQNLVGQNQCSRQPGADHEVSHSAYSGVFPDAANLASAH
jgi:hypothetical protein